MQKYHLTGMALAQYEIELKMSRKGDCRDNALMERFFGRLNAECVDRQRLLTRQQAPTTLFEYIDVFSDRQRFHSTFGYQTPIAFEQAGQTAPLPTP